jgi:hypothetical protein
MLDLEVVPERALACPEKNWEFILGEILRNFSLFAFGKKYFI